MPGRQRLQKAGEALAIGFEPARQLEHDRAEFFRERLDPREEPKNPLLRLLEALHVGQIAAALAGEDEALRRRLAPAAEGRDLDQPVEGAVDLDRVEALGIAAQLLDPFAHAARIERPAPMLVAPARRPDEAASLSHGYGSFARRVAVLCPPLDE